MTTISKDITNFLEEQGIARGPSVSGAVLSRYNPIRMMLLLGKLDHEDLEDLLNILDDAVNKPEDSWERSQQWQEGYDKGYSDAAMED